MVLVAGNVGLERMKRPMRGDVGDVKEDRRFVLAEVVDTTAERWISSADRPPMGGPQGLIGQR